MWKSYHQKNGEETEKAEKPAQAITTNSRARNGIRCLGLRNRFQFILVIVYC